MQNNMMDEKELVAQKMFNQKLEEVATYLFTSKEQNLTRDDIKKKYELTDTELDNLFELVADCYKGKDASICQIILRLNADRAPAMFQKIKEANIELRREVDLAKKINNENADTIKKLREELVKLSSNDQQKNEQLQIDVQNKKNEILELKTTIEQLKKEIEELRTETEKPLTVEKKPDTDPDADTAYLSSLQAKEKKRINFKLPFKANPVTFVMGGIGLVVFIAVCITAFGLLKPTSEVIEGRATATNGELNQTLPQIVQDSNATNQNSVPASVSIQTPKETIISGEPTPIAPVYQTQTAQSPTPNATTETIAINNEEDLKKYSSKMSVTPNNELMFGGKKYTVGADFYGYKIVAVQKTFIRFNSPKDNFNFRIDIAN